jgi:hypothetical protein
VKFRDIGLVTGLAIGGVIMAMGLFVMSFGDFEPGGNGLMLILGGLVFIPGLFIAVVSFFGWLSSSFYSSLSPKYRRYLGWGVLIFLVGFVGITSVKNLGELKAGYNTYNTDFEERLVEEGIDAKQIATARKLLVGQWERIENPNYIIIFDEQGEVISTEDGNLLIEATWSLGVGPHVVDKTFAYDVIVEKQDKSWWVIIRHLDSEKLVIHSDDDENGTAYKRSSDKKEQVELQ